MGTIYIYSLGRIYCHIAALGEAGGTAAGLAIASDSWMEVIQIYVQTKVPKIIFGMQTYCEHSIAKRRRIHQAKSYLW